MELFHTKQHWLHYIGGHYRSHHDFLKEARRSGITRRIPAHVARGFNFGDTITLLRYQGPGRVYAFGEFVVSGLNLDQGIADAVGEALKQQGKATFEGGGGSVFRECGSYEIGGTWKVDASIQDVLDLAEAEAEKRGEKLWVMLGGILSQVYDAPRWLSPAPAFTRGFIRNDDQTTFTPFSDDDNILTSITNYRKKANQRTSAPRSRKAPKGQTALAFA